MHIIFLIDKSGSMSDKINPTIDGYNNFIENQQKLETEDKCKVSLYLFSHNLETIYENRELDDTYKLNKKNYVPEGSTALFDSMGYILNNINDKEKTIFVVITDGQENSSDEYTDSDIKEMIESRKDYLEMIYMGSNQDAILAGNNMGSQVNINYDDIQTPNIYRGLSSAVTRVRQRKTPTIIFTQDEINTFTIQSETESQSQPF
jgi:hypothetical protein